MNPDPLADPWVRVAVLAFCLPPLLGLLCGFCQWVADLVHWFRTGEPPPVEPNPRGFSRRW